ncbi:MAG: ferritin-like domain-containing protein, partial [Myxococcaceae bacterium]
MPIDYATLSLQDALDFAILIEDEARERYTEFAKMLGKRYPGDAADFFSAMVVNETKHAKDLQAKRKKLFKSAKRQVDRSMFTDVEAPDYGKPRIFMSPRQAMEVALESEVKAFDFYDDALKYVKDKDVRALFEDLRAEEKKHQQAIRKQMKNLPAGPDIDEDAADEPPALQSGHRGGFAHAAREVVAEDLAVVPAASGGGAGSGLAQPDPVAQALAGEAHHPFDLLGGDLHAAQLAEAEGPPGLGEQLAAGEPAAEGLGLQHPAGAIAAQGLEGGALVLHAERGGERGAVHLERPGEVGRGGAQGRSALHHVGGGGGEPLLAEDVGGRAGGPAAGGVEEGRAQHHA